MTLRAGIRLALLAGLLLPVSARGQETAPATPVQPGQKREQPEPGSYVFPSGKERARYWAKRTMGPTALVGATMGATWGTWVTNEPPEWGKRGEGFGRRFGTSLATNGINQTSLALISEATRQDSAYYRCPCSGFGRRLGHVLKMTFMGRNRKGAMVFRQDDFALHRPDGDAKHALSGSLRSRRRGHQRGVRHRSERRLELRV